MAWMSQADLIKKSFRLLLQEVATGVPGQIVSFNPATQYAQVQIGIKELDDKTGDLFAPDILIECYVQALGGKFSIETQADPGDEGMIHFSQRCIDGWMSSGGIADNPRPLQTHDFSDCVFYLGGARSEPNRLDDFQNNGIRLRNTDGSHYVWLKNDGSILLDNDAASITISPSGDITLTNNSGSFSLSSAGAVSIDASAVSINSGGDMTIQAAGNVAISGATMTHNGVTIGADHTHSAGSYQADGSPVTGTSGTP